LVVQIKIEGKIFYLLLFKNKRMALPWMWIVIIIIIIFFLIYVKHWASKSLKKCKVGFTGKWAHFSPHSNHILGNKWSLGRGIKMYRPWFGKDNKTNSYLGKISLDTNEYMTLKLNTREGLGIYHEVNVYDYASMELIESIPMFKEGSFKCHIDSEIIVILKTIGDESENIYLNHDIQIGSMCLKDNQGNLFRSRWDSIHYDCGNYESQQFDSYYNQLLNEWKQGYQCVNKGISSVSTTTPKSSFLRVSSATVDLNPGEWILIVYPNSPISWFSIISIGTAYCPENMYDDENKSAISHLIYNRQQESGNVDINLSYYGAVDIPFHYYILIQQPGLISIA
jgi:hypothetical protein